MHWVLNGEVDITAHKGTLYIIDAEYTPLVNHLDGKGTLPIGPQQVTDENGDIDPRDLAADICAQHAGVPTGNHQFISIWNTAADESTAETTAQEQRTEATSPPQ